MRRPDVARTPGVANRVTLLAMGPVSKSVTANSSGASSCFRITEVVCAERVACSNRRSRIENFPTLVAFEGP